jgi:hypothetical protein
VQKIDGLGQKPQLSLQICYTNVAYSGL